jgi:16S rRNA (uracil1498-N3)-methyltransferase
VNLLLLEDGETSVGGRRGRHLVEVLRVTPGQRVRAGIVGGAVGEAEIVSVEGSDVQLRFEATGPASAPQPVDLVLAVPRPKVLSRVLQHAAAYGVRRIDLVNAWRVDKSYLGSSKLDLDAIAENLRLGAEQGMTTHLPEIAVHKRLMAYLDEVHAQVTPADARKLLADARTGDHIERVVPAGFAAPVVIAIGPEGGWIQRELDTFAARGFAIVRLGAEVLRVEAAVTAALAQLSLLRRLTARNA